MTNNADAQIAREWAERVAEESDAYSFAQRTAAAHILATTPPPTMADLDWDDEEHPGLCAEHTKLGTVRMLSEWRGEIACFMEDCATLWLAPKFLTPLPGTRVDLTPRRAGGWEA